MIEVLQQELNQLSDRSKAQSIQIKDLFLSLGEIQKQKNLIKFQQEQTRDRLLILRPEIHTRILQFLTFKEFLGFRLVGRMQNFIVRTNVIFRIDQSKQQISSFTQLIISETANFEELQKAVGPEIEDKKKEAQDSLLPLNQKDLNELKACKVLHETVVNLFQFLIILLNPKQNTTTQEDCKQLLQDPNTVTKLIQLDARSITDGQLKKLNKFDQLTYDQVVKVSNACGIFYNFLRRTIDLRRTQIYQLWGKIENLKQEQRNLTQKIQRLGKIMIK